MLRQLVRGLAALVIVVNLPGVAGAALLRPVIRAPRGVEAPPPVYTIGTETPGTVVFRDDFSASALDTSKWMVGTWSMQRTRYGNTPTLANGLATLRLDTYNAQAPGTAMRGTEILSRQNFARSGGIEYSARMRMRTMAGGLVAGFYTFAPEPGMVSTSDEIDFEFLSNWNNQNLAGGDRILMSTYNDWNYATSRFFDGVHHSDARPQISGLDMGQFNTFTMRWLPDRTEWLVNGREVHATSNALADEPMPIKFNFWAPSTVWGDAYSAGLMPTGDPTANRSFYYDLDWAEVKVIAAGAGLSAEGPAALTGPAVPEPGAGGVVALASGVILGRRRRGSRGA